MCTDGCVYPSMHVCMYVYASQYVHLSINRHMHIYIQSYVYTHIEVCTNTHKQTYIYLCIYTKSESEREKSTTKNGRGLRPAEKMPTRHTCVGPVHWASTFKICRLCGATPLTRMSGKECFTRQVTSQAACQLPAMICTFIKGSMRRLHASVQWLDCEVVWCSGCVAHTFP
jgi:hypothetical protein